MNPPRYQPTNLRPRIPVRHDFLLSGLFSCGICHRQMIGERQKGHVYYRCHGRHHPGSGVREEALAAAIGEAFARLDTRWAAERLREAGPRRFRLEGEQRAELEWELTRIAHRLEQLTDLYLDGQIEHEDYRARRASLASQKTELERKLLSRSEPSPAEPDLDLVRIYQAASVQERLELILCLTERREVSGKQVHIALHGSTAI